MTNANLNNYMYEFIEKICNEVGPRESGTEQELRAGDMIEEELKKFCDEAHQEEYISSPHAFLGGIRYGALMGLVSIILFWLSLLVDLRILQIANLYSLLFNIIAVILIIVAFCYFILEVMNIP